MPRALAAALAAAFLAVGCFGDGGEDDGTLDPAALHRVADRATFQVRIPDRLGSAYRLLSVGSLTRDDGHYNVSFDVVAGEGPVLNVDEGENAAVGVIRSWTKGATALGEERIGGVAWRVYDQPSVGGLVYARRCDDGVELILAGDGSREPLRALAAALV